MTEDVTKESLDTRELDRVRSTFHEGYLSGYESASYRPKLVPAFWFVCGVSVGVILSALALL